MTIGSRAGATLTTAGVAVGLVGVALYATGFQVHLSPAIVSLLLVKATFAAAGGLMVTGAVLSRRALSASRDDPNAVGSRERTARLGGASTPEPDATSNPPE